MSNMSQFLHLKDKFDNDMWFGDTGQVRLAALPNVTDYSKQLQRIADIKLRSDDVLVVGYPKSGNNWMHHMTSMLLAGSTDLPPMTNTNFHFIDNFGGDLKLPPLDKPRALLTHLPFRFLPRDVMEKKVKIIYVTRNPKDVFVSLFSHLSKVKAPLGYDGSWPQFFEVMLDQGYWYGNVFDHLKDWERELMSHPDLPVFDCNYEAMKKDTVGQLERLNQFLGTCRSKELCQDIVSECRISNMHLSRRNDRKGKDPFCWKEGACQHNMYRKGAVGDWKNWFTAEQNERFDVVFANSMGDYKRKFVFE